MSLRLFALALVLLGCLVLPSLAQSCYAPSALNFTSERGGLWVNGNSFKLKGASWFGFETSSKVVHGLWSQSYTFFLDFLANNGFNAIRLPFYLDLAINDASPNGINYGAGSNSDLQGLSSLQVMDKIIQAAAARGIVIMLDLHSFSPDSYASDSLWYNGNNPESKVISGWTKILQRYSNQWNVIAADLKNEPYSGTWATGNANTDWDKAAARIANAIASSVSSRYLMFVEGIASGCSDACFYGESLVGVRSNPIVLANPSKLVYSPHVYGPNVYGQPYFSAGNFPSNMAAIWEAHWGFVPGATGNAVVLGEWGGPYSGKDAQWMNALQTYLVSKGMTDQFFWCLNPDSGDTGGLLQNDWASPVTEKLTLLAGLVSKPTKFAVNSAGQVCINGGTTAASPSSSPAAPKASSSPAAAASPSHSPSAVKASPSPAAPQASSSPAPKTSSTPSGGITFASGSSVWWMALTIPGSTSVQIDCGNGQGFVAMTPGWTANLWTFSSGNGTPCKSSLRFIVNGGAAQTVTAPF